MVHENLAKIRVKSIGDHSSKIFHIFQFDSLMNPTTIVDKLSRILIVQSLVLYVTETEV